METLKHFLKRLEVSVTDLQHRYTSDIFFRTTLYIVGIQVLLVVITVTVFVFILDYSNKEIAQAVIAHLAQILESHGSVSPAALTQTIENVQTSTTLLVFFGMTLLSILMGFVLSYVTLRPTRKALENQKLFISNIAHELRTPLAVIKTVTEVELLSDNLSQSVRETLSSIVAEVERASGVVNNLLSLNRLLRPERMEFVDVDLAPIVSRVVERTSHVAQERGIVVTTNTAQFCVVHGNSVALEQLVINLLNNALQYTPQNKGGHIAITVEPDYTGMLVLSVADNGIGISQEDLFHIFEPFYRADKSRVRNVKQGGSGLGLAIVNEIVRAHHGKVRIQSAPNKGTVVTVLLPIGKNTLHSPTPVDPPTTDLNEVALDFSNTSDAVTPQDTLQTRLFENK